VFYGTAPMKDERPDTDALSKIHCPVLGHYGGNDARVTATVGATERAMHESGKFFESHVYQGAGHGFVRQHDGENNAAAKEAWERTVVFLKARLEQ